MGYLERIKEETGEGELNINGGWAIVTVRNPDLSVAWSERVRIPNLITNVGKNEIMLNGLSGNFLFLTGATPAFASGDTMAANSFTELTAYSESAPGVHGSGDRHPGNRQQRRQPRPILDQREHHCWRLRASHVQHQGRDGQRADLWPRTGGRDSIRSWSVSPAARGRPRSRR